MAGQTFKFSFDPLLHLARVEGGEPADRVRAIDPDLYRRVPGYDIWPSDLSLDATRNRIVTYGGSTSDRLAGGHWPMFLSDIINRGAAPHTLIINGGCAAYSSTNELLKALRELPAFNPDIVLSLSGMNDVGFMHNHNNYPFMRRDQVTFADAVGRSVETFEGHVLGVPWDTTTAENWLRSMRLLHQVVQDAGAVFLAFLQPAMGAGPYRPTPEEEAMYREQSALVSFGGQSYEEAMTAHYGAIRERLAEHPFIVDITDVFANESGVFFEYRHPNEKGQRLIAERIFDELKQRVLLPET